jgi:hypothetical protein
VQVAFPFGTRPSLVGELNVELTVSTVVPGGCSTVILAQGIPLTPILPPAI